MAETLTPPEERLRNTESIAACTLSHVGTGRNSFCSDSGWKWRFWPHHFSSFDTITTHFCIAFTEPIDNLDPWIRHGAMNVIEASNHSPLLKKAHTYGEWVPPSGEYHSQPIVTTAWPMQILLAEESITGDYKLFSRELKSREDLEQTLRGSNANAAFRWTIRTAIGCLNKHDVNATPLVIRLSVGSEESAWLLTVDAADSCKLAVEKVEGPEDEKNARFQWTLKTHMLNLSSPW